MKIGISFSLVGKTYQRFGNNKYAVLRRHGYSAIDYNFSNTDIPWYHFDEATLKSKAEEERSSAQAAGIFISQVHGPWCWPPPETSGEGLVKRMEQMKKAAVITSLLGCKHLVIHPIMPYGVKDLELEKAQETWDLNLAFFKELVAFAKQYNVIICLENMPMKKFSIAKPEHILKFVKKINDESLQICLDTGHVSVFPDLSIGEEIRRLGDYIKVFHIHDNAGDRDSHLYPTKGIINWSDFANAVREIGFNGVLSLETAPSSDLDDDQFEQESIKLYHLLYEQVKEKFSLPETL
jgi:sugar phosphate isomerase/epimerase